MWVEGGGGVKGGGGGGGIWPAYGTDEVEGNLSGHGGRAGVAWSNCT